MDYDFVAGQMNITTIAEVGITVGHDYIVQNMTWNGSEYFCNTPDFGFFTMDTAGVQTIIESSVPSRDLGVKY